MTFPSAKSQAVLRTAGSVVSVGLVVWVVWRAVGSANVRHVSVAYVFASSVAGIVAWVGLASAWVALAGEDRWGPGATAWAKSQSLRYLPGAIWAPLARSRRVSGGAAAKATTVLTEAVLTGAMAVGVGGAAMLISGSAWFGGLVVAPVAGVLVVGVLGRRVAVVPERVVFALALYCASWLAYALSVVWAQYSVGPVSDPWRVAGAALLSWAAGFVVVWMPSGLGARELAYVALVRGTIPSGRALTGSLVARATLTAGELVTLVVLLASRRRAKESSPVP